MPVLLPTDSVVAMQMLADVDLRKTAGISIQNNYVFASIQDSLNHVSGWHAVNSVCTKVDIKDKIRLTATKNRHRVSTIFAALDLSENDRNLFYQHMGHSKEVNQAIYQAPPALMELMKVGKHLKRIDEGMIRGPRNSHFTMINFCDPKILRKIFAFIYFREIQKGSY